MTLTFWASFSNVQDSEVKVWVKNVIYSFDIDLDPMTLKFKTPFANFPLHNASLM